MPNYDYFCRNCDHSFSEYMKIDDRNHPKNEPCPHCGKIEIDIQIGAPALASPIVLGIRKPSDGFRDRMKEIKDNFKNDPHAKIKEY